MKSLVSIRMFCMAMLGVAVLAGGCASPMASNPIQAEFDEAIDRVPTEKTLHAMGRLLVARHDDERAAYVFTRVIHEHPDYVPVYVELAELHVRNQRLDDAAEVLTAGIDTNPGHAMLHNNLGMCRMMQEDYAAASSQFEQAIALSPTQSRYHANNGTALALAGDYDGALDHYMRVMSRSNAWHNLEVISENRGELEEAEAAWDRMRGR